MAGREKARLDALAKRCELALGTLGPVEARRMFGGYGLFLDVLMFALVADDRLYFKTDERTKRTFMEAGSIPFRYLRQGRWIELAYWSSPEDPFGAADRLWPWAGDAVGVARRASKDKVKRVSRRSR